jgi:hypothetical protein
MNINPVVIPASATDSYLVLEEMELSAYPEAK